MLLPRSKFPRSLLTRTPNSLKGRINPPFPQVGRRRTRGFQCRQQVLGGWVGLVVLRASLQDTLISRVAHHHRVRAEKSFPRGAANICSRPWVILTAEQQKCDLLCVLPCRIRGSLRSRSINKICLAHLAFLELHGYNACNREVHGSLAQLVRAGNS